MWIHIAEAFQCYGREALQCRGVVHCSTWLLLGGWYHGIMVWCRYHQGCRICGSMVALLPGTFFNRHFYTIYAIFTWFYAILRDFCAILHDFYTILRNFCDFYAILCQAQIFCCQAPKTILHPCWWISDSLKSEHGTSEATKRDIQHHAGNSNCNGGGKFW